MTATAAFGITLMSAAKVARVAVLAERADDLTVWAYLPASLGQDALLTALLVLVAIGTAKLKRAVIGWALWTPPVLLPALLLPADVISHKLTGAPITWQRLRGDEGATLGDLDLLARTDFVDGILSLAASVLLIAVCLRWAHRLRPLHWFCRVRNAALLAIAALPLVFAQEYFLHGAHGLADQPVFILIASLRGGYSVTAQEISHGEWEALHRPTTKPRKSYTGISTSADHPRSVIVFLAEGIPFKHTSFGDPAARKATPMLQKRARREGMLFSRYYANWHASNQAIFSVVCSAFPPIGAGIAKVKPRIDCGEFSEVLRDNGLRVGLFHAGRFSFYNKLALLGRRGYEIELDSEELKRTSTYSTTRWGIDDRAMVDALLEWIDTLPKNQPFGALLIPITAHYPYWVPKNFKNTIRGGTRMHRFLNAVAFQDRVFERMARGLQSRGRYDDTLLVWLGDHGHFVQEPNRETPGVRNFYDANLHTPLVMINRKLFGPGDSTDVRTSTRIGSHPDLLPTILDALGYDQDPRHQGQSLLAKDYQPRRVFFGAQAGNYIGFIEHDRKFVLKLGNKRTEYYDLAADPDETRNIGEQAPELMQRYTKDVLRFAGAVEARFSAAPVLSEDVDISDLYALVREHAELRLVGQEETVVCKATDDSHQRVCPGLGEMFSRKRPRLYGEKRNCLMLRLPADRNLEMDIRDTTTLDLMTSTIAALPGKGDSNELVRVQAISDGRDGPIVSVGLTRARRIEYPRAKQRLLLTFAPGRDRGGGNICLQLSNLPP